MSDAANQAWDDYRAAVEDIRARLLALDCARSEDGRAQAHAFLLQAEAAAYNLVIAPDPARPRLLTQTVFTPGTYDWMLPNPDFLYRYVFVDGSRSHRLTGTRGYSHYLEAQGIAGFFGDPDLKLLDTLEFAALPGDGHIDAIIGPEAPDGDQLWIRTEPGRMNTVVIREAFYDWPSEAGAELSIEPVGIAPPTPFNLPQKLEAAARMLSFVIATFGPEFCAQVTATAGENAFVHVDTSRDADAANPNAAYVPGNFRLSPQQAMLLEFAVPDARYWGIHLGDLWSRTADYVGRQSSLNGRQVHVDPDGRVRIVVSAVDPGVGNWLDTGGAAEGMLLLRWYRATSAPVPTARIIDLATVASVLPTSTPRIDASARAAVLLARRAAVDRRTG